jgi:hypothetical protein
VVDERLRKTITTHEIVEREDFHMNRLIKAFVNNEGNTVEVLPKSTWKRKANGVLHVVERVWRSTTNNSAYVKHQNQANKIKSDMRYDRFIAEFEKVSD